MKLNNEIIKIRSSKPLDERLIREHFYNLDRLDVQRRFFHIKRNFNRNDAESQTNIDYISSLTLLGSVGRPGF